MKKNFLILFVFGILNVNAQIAKVKYGQLQIDDTHLIDDKGKQITLRGVTYGWSNREYPFYNDSTVAWLSSDWNCSVIRATVAVEPENGYLQNQEETFKYVERLIKGAVSNGVYIVIAWHCHNMHLDSSKLFFEELAIKYGNYPNIIYEVFTEPDDESWHDLKPYYTDLIQTIRKHDSDNIILLSAPYWSQNIKEVADDPLIGFNNTMFTVHFCTGDSGKELRETCNYAINKGIPIFISDHLLTDCSCNGKIHVDAWQEWLDWFEANKLSWIVWNISSKDESCSLLKPSANKNGSWDITDLSEGGKLVREKLRQFE